MPIDKIVIKGAREHNLKNIDLELPRDKLIVMTGLSGSGKSSLAFDTIYADGQRRYVESLSSYARMFLGQMDKPDVDSIEGLSPAISIDQKTTSKNPRSTVGTVTEIYDYFRLLFARIGVPHCPVCGREIKQQTVDQIVDKISSLPQGTKIQILAPVVRGRKGEHTKELEAAGKSGYVRVRIDGIVYDLSEEIKLEKNKKHTIEIVVDRLVVKSEMGTRLADSIETARRIVEMHPDTVRIYPTVVLRGTRLCELAKSGEFKPKGLPETVELCSKLIPMFENAGIKVIRVGLHSGGGVEEGFVAGAYHPALRELCEGRIYLNAALERLGGLPSGRYLLSVAPGENSKMTGQRKCNIIALRERGWDCTVKCREGLKKYEVDAAALPGQAADKGQVIR